MGLSDHDRAILQGCRDGEESAWMDLYRTYSPSVGLFLKGMLNNPSDVDDLVQKVFLEFLSSLDRFRGDSGIRTWLHSIARNVALREIRSSSRRAAHMKSYADTQNANKTSSEDRILARYRLTLIQNLLAELDTTFREIWILRELVGLSTHEVAEVLDIPTATVRTRHYRARLKLFERIEHMDEVDVSHLTKSAEHLTLVWDKRSEG